VKILLLLPWEKDYKAYRDKFSAMLSYAPLTLATIAALIPPELNAEVDVCDEMMQTIDYDKHYDIVAISFVTSSSPRAYNLAKTFKEKGSYILFGGYHTTLLPEEAAKHADTIIVGPAEKSFPQFLTDYAKGKPEKEYKIPCVMAEDYKIPRRDLLPKKGYVKTPCITANPGCPNKCEFCAIQKMNPPNPRPISDVIDEIKLLNTKSLIFFDPNFFQNRQYALELMSELKKLKLRWASTMTVKTAFDEELVTEAQKSGCIGCTMGIESLNHDSLLSVKKGFNDPKKYKQAIDIIKEHNMCINGCFVLGLDSDTKESLSSLVEQADYLGITVARFALLTPNPGSSLFEKLENEGRILTKDWSKYNYDHVVFQPKNMTPNELMEIYLKTWKDFYKIGRIFGRMKQAPSFSTKMIALGMNLGFKYVGSTVKRGLQC